jgi:hypothetical protein
MKPNSIFLNLPKKFWACVRLISQEVGYTERKTRRIKVPTLLSMETRLDHFGINLELLQAQQINSNLTYGTLLQNYFAYRADILNSFVEPHLMNGEKAKKVFEEYYKKIKPSFPVPMNKQKAEMKAPAYFTGLVNMLIEANGKGLPCDCDPQKLTIITKDGLPIRTLARRIDGAFPSSINPIAIWEIKEYYYTTTFGSRVADGIYESLLDGLELEELREHEGLDIKHYLMVDAHDTWWKQGKSYLCRIVDMLHMGYIDEVLFGFEVVERLPDLVGEWIKIYNASRAV